MDSNTLGIHPTIAVNAMLSESMQLLKILQSEKSHMVANSITLGEIEKLIPQLLVFPDTTKSSLNVHWVKLLEGEVENLNNAIISVLAAFRDTNFTNGLLAKVPTHFSIFNISQAKHWKDWIAALCKNTQYFNEILLTPSVVPNQFHVGAFAFPKQLLQFAKWQYAAAQAVQSEQVYEDLSLLMANDKIQVGIQFLP